MKFRIFLGYLFAVLVAIAAVTVVCLPLIALAQSGGAPALLPSPEMGIQGWLQAFTNIPALGLVAWLFHRLITQTIPKQAADFKDELTAIRGDFKETLEQQREDAITQAKAARDDFVALINKQQEAFEDMATRQAQSYEASLQREREFHKSQVDGILDSLKERTG